MDETPHASMKSCFKCKEPFLATLEYFYSDASKKDGLSPRCKHCYKIDRKPRYVPPEGHKYCPDCGNDFPATHDYFHRDVYRPDGLVAYCKPCERTRKIARYDRELIRTGKVRRPGNRKGEGIDIEGHKAYMKQWFQNGGNEIVKANTRNRRARLRQAEGKHTAKDIRVQYERQQGKCYYCKKKLGSSYHVDHIVPIARGGSNDPSNLVVTCHTCNERKNDRLPHEWHEGGRLL